MILAAQCAWVLAFPLCDHSQQLPFHQYKVGDGLPHARIKCLYQDDKGYLWLGTWDGLARFDGYQFISYGTRDGIGNPLINAVTQDRRLRLWVATNGGGIARLRDPEETARAGGGIPPERAKFVSYNIAESPAANSVNGLLIDSDDNIWCVTDAGLYRGVLDAGGEPGPFTLIEPCGVLNWSPAVLSDSRGRRWLGVGGRLVESRGADILRYGQADGFSGDELVSAVEDHVGHVFVAGLREVVELVDDGAGRAKWRPLPLALLPNQAIHALALDASGALWIGTSLGLIEYHGGRQTLYRTTQGLSDDHILSLLEDRETNLWVGTASGGVCRLSHEKVTSYTTREGLPDQNVVWVTESHDGRIYASTDGGIVEISAGIGAEPTGGRALPLRESLTPLFLGANRRLRQDRRGDWWVGTSNGLYRFSGPGLQLRHGRRMVAADGLPAINVANGTGFEDSDGTLWFGMDDGNLYRLDAAHVARPAFQSMPIRPLAFARDIERDRSGNLWIASPDRLARQTGDRLQEIGTGNGLPDTRVRALFVDSRGWLWVGFRYGGAAVCEDPGAASPRFSAFTAENGLASDTVLSLTEDSRGRIYLGTSRGLDQLDVASRHVRHFTTADGLAGDNINYCMRDRAGRIWVGASGGVSCLDSRDEAPAGEAPVYLSRLQIAGEDALLPETGAREIAEIVLPASRNNLSIEFVGLSFASDPVLLYQYKLDGIDADWSAPSVQRSVTYARLSPGVYRFVARAMDRDGRTRGAPAILPFRILPPIWQRWWFVAAAASLLLLLLYAGFRYRVAQLVQLERVRTRIATDLHDDIGSNLSLVAMLSEVVRHQVEGDGQVGERLSLIARISRELVDGMSDIVWAVNPQKDRLGDLTQRMRRFASDILSARDVALRFTATGLAPDLKLGADLRRQIYLVFKESLNNAARHSRCKAVEVECAREDGKLAVKIADDGVGFDPARVDAGTGVHSMRRRAEQLGGTFDIASRPGGGTVVMLAVPLTRRRWRGASFIHRER